MAFQVNYISYVLHFKFDAKTSRGSLKDKKTYFIKLYNTHNPSIIGWGEAGPLAGLSPDALPNFEEILLQFCNKINALNIDHLKDLTSAIENLISAEFPSIKFALETALLDWQNGGNKIIFNTPFVKGTQSMLINGLIWMGSKAFMLEQLEKKLKEGYHCIKIKVGGIDFDEECKILQLIRENFTPTQLALRLDANGAFGAKDVYQKLEKLASYHIHSIEQPIAPKNHTLMADLCKISPIPIALDEELIGIYEDSKRKELLNFIKPQFIILKPTLLGGLQACQQWITIAESLQIGWWITSMLESNIGLNAIAQFTATYNPSLPQGLGTGQLYSNNIASPLYIESEYLKYNPATDWSI